MKNTLNTYTYIHNSPNTEVFDFMKKNTTIGKGKDALQHSNSGDFRDVFLSKKKAAH